MESVLNVDVSIFENYFDSKNPKKVNLLTWLQSKEYKSVIESTRSLGDKSEIKKLKESLPAVTPSGLFKKRSENCLIKHSGLIQIDLDRSLNLHIDNWEDLKDEITNLYEIAYFGLSVSGNSYWGLIPIPPDAENHKFYFEAIYQKFQSYSINLDPAPKSISSLRGFSIDENAYFNHKAKVFEQLPSPKQKQSLKKTDFVNSSQEILDRIIKKMESAPENSRHYERLNAGLNLGNYIGKGLLDASAIDKVKESYLNQFGSLDDDSTIKRELKAIEDGVQMGIKNVF